MSHPFRQIDVFGADPYAGNPVAVVLAADDVSDEAMRRFSVWTNLSECTFVLAPTVPGADYRVRILNLDRELSFAGHPTLGTARAWLDAGGAPATPGVVVQECGVGLVPVRIEGDLLAFAAPPRIRSGAVDPALVSEVLAILGVDPARVVAAEWLDNGPGWVGVLLDSADTVLALRPDLTGHPGTWDIGVIGPAAPGADFDIEVRAFFSTDDGLREDPVTGSLNASAAQWLMSGGRVGASYVARQGTALGRDGRVHLSRRDGEIWVGGRTDVAVRGTIAI